MRSSTGTPSWPGRPGSIRRSTTRRPCRSRRSAPAPGKASIGHEKSGVVLEKIWENYGSVGVVVEFWGDVGLVCRTRLDL